MNSVRIVEPAGRSGAGNSYDGSMCSFGMRTGNPGNPLLVARLHVDLCRLASAICR